MIGMDGQPERTFWVADLSTNGTWLNGEILEKGIRTQLKDGDEILVINDELQDSSSRVRFGFRFTVFTEENAPRISQPPQQFVQEFKEKMASQRLRTKTSKRNRDFEFSDSEEDSSKSNGRKKPKKRNDSDNEFSTRPSVSRKKTTFFDEDDDRDSPMKKDGSGSIPPKKSDRIMKQWTPEEEKKLVEVMSKSEGKSWKEIAVHFPHRSPDAVRNKFKKMSETDKVAKSFWAATISKQQARAAATTPTATTPEQEEQAPPSLEKDQVQAEAEEEIKDTSSQQPAGLLPVKEEEEEDRRRKLWTAEEDEQLKQLIKKFRPTTNEDWEQIAGKLGRTVKSVKHKYNDHNLKYLLET